MKSTKKIKVSLFGLVSIILILFGITACDETSTKINGEDLVYEGDLLITGFDEDINIPYVDIYNNEDLKVTTSVQGLTSSEELLQFEATGVILSDVLSKYNYNIDNIESIRLIAIDGYAIDVPKETFQKKDIILGYYIDGEQIEEELQPIRAFINDERTMYWVSQLKQIDISYNEKEELSNTNESIDKVLLFETAIRDLEKYDYDYNESIDEAIRVTDLFESYLEDIPENLYLVATDGFEKSEKSKVLEQGFIKITGEFSPLFTGQDLPEGMQIKDILYLNCGDTRIINVSGTEGLYSKRSVDNVEGIALDEFIKASLVESDAYIFVAKDGYSKELTMEELEKGIIIKEENADYVEFKIKFPEEVPSSKNICDLLMIDSANQ